MDMSARMTGVDGLLDTIADVRARWTERVEYSVGTNVNYAVHVEYGTSSMAAQPFLRPAAERTRRTFDRLADKADSLSEFVTLAAQSVERIAKELCPVDTGNLRASISATRVA